jgi:prepilin-type N-terminal cleavage/methylation domain-containing protein
MRKTIKKAFTLIELLVVITIIWILATGATWVYTSQIQKARDSTRLSDVKAIQSSVEQAYQDAAEYPPTTGTGFYDKVKAYIDKLPSDPKEFKPWNKSGYTGSGKTLTLWYVYMVWEDDNWIENSVYEVSTGFEANWNVNWKAKNDRWDDAGRQEIGHTSKDLDTSLDGGLTISDDCDAVNDETTNALIVREWKLCVATTIAIDKTK